MDNVLLALEGLDSLLNYGTSIIICYENKLNIVSKQVEVLDGVILIENLQSSANKVIANLSNSMINHFFSSESLENNTHN